MIIRPGIFLNLKIFLFFALFSSFIELYLMYNIVLVLGTQYNDVIYIYIVKWLPQ